MTTVSPAIEKVLSGLNPEQIMNHLTGRDGIADWFLETARSALEQATPQQRRRVFDTVFDHDAVAASLSMATFDELWEQLQGRALGAMLIMESPGSSPGAGTDIHVRTAGTPAQQAGLVQFAALHFHKLWARLLH